MRAAEPAALESVRIEAVSRAARSAMEALPLVTDPFGPPLRHASSSDGRRAGLGGGACIVSALDFRIGADDCFVAYPEAGLGIPLSWVSLPLCVHLVGPARAKRLTILAQREAAPTLLEWGFLDEVVPKGELLERALEMAQELAAKPPIAAQMVKRSVNAISSALDHAIMHMDSDQVLLAQTSEDFGEAVRAFFEKRKPDFKGG